MTANGGDQSPGSRPLATRALLVALGLSLSFVLWEFGLRGAVLVVAGGLLGYFYRGGGVRGLGAYLTAVGFGGLVIGLPIVIGAQPCGTHFPSSIPSGSRCYGAGTLPLLIAVGAVAVAGPVLLLLASRATHRQSAP